MNLPRLGALYDAALSTLGWLALAGSLATALHDASIAFDSWYYHLPFAARLAGVISSDTYVFHPANEARYAGFALLAELAQGWLWRLTGRAESANLVAFVSVPLVALYAQRRWRVPFSYGVLALLAVPLIQTHAPSCYVDLPGNAAAAVLVLLVFEAYASDAALPRSDLFLALALGATAANIKPLLQPIVGVALGALFGKVAWEARRPTSRSRAIVQLASMLAAAPLILFTPLKNAVLHGNPFYPIAVHPFGLDWPGPEAPYASSPAWLEPWPRPVRFACSVLEIGIRPLTDPHRWTVDQWMPDALGGNRLGGFFGAYAVLFLLGLVYQVGRDRTRLARVSGLGFAVLTCVVAWLPQSHELRYYLSWMIVLVVLNLGLACQRQPASLAGRPRLLATIAALAFVAVVASTRGVYAYPRGITVADLVRSRVDPKILAAVPEGATRCIAAEPFNLLWADVFHAPRHYVVKEAETDADCAGVTPFVAKTRPE